MVGSGPPIASPELQGAVAAAAAEPSHYRLDKGAISLVTGQVAKALHADRSFIHHQPIQHLLEEAWLFATDLEAQEEEGLGVAAQRSLGSADAMTPICAHWIQERRRVDCAGLS